MNLSHWYVPITRLAMAYVQYFTFMETLRPQYVVYFLKEPTSLILIFFAKPLITSHWPVRGNE